MKRALIVAGIIVVVLALLAWVATWFRTPQAVAESASREWPDGMGTLESVEARFPPQRANAAAVRLTALGKAMPKNDALEIFVGREMERGEVTIGNPPPSLPDVAAIRDLLLREPIVWSRYEGIGGDEDSSSMRGMQMTMGRALAGDALAKAHTNDASGWDDLHAAWNLARSLEREPQMMTRTAYLSMTRMINAVAWKMPLPAPAWFAEVERHDAIRPILESFQYTVSSYWKDGARIFPTKMLANSVDVDRARATSMLHETRCDVTPSMNRIGVDISSIWHRAFRYRAEREATANALRARAGLPVDLHSQCSDGTWSFDGTTLRFSRAIASGPPDRPMPLVLRLRSSG